MNDRKQERTNEQKQTKKDKKETHNPNRWWYEMPATLVAFGHVSMLGMATRKVPDLTQFQPLLSICSCAWAKAPTPCPASIPGQRLERAWPFRCPEGCREIGRIGKTQQKKQMGVDQYSPQMTMAYCSHLEGKHTYCLVVFHNGPPMQRTLINQMQAFQHPKPMQCFSWMAERQTPPQCCPFPTEQKRTTGLLKQEQIVHYFLAAVARCPTSQTQACLLHRFRRTRATPSQGTWSRMRRANPECQLEIPSTWPTGLLILPSLSGGLKGNKPNF